MWWKCDVLVRRTVLRLKVWARDEGEARNKVQRMYQISTIQSLTADEFRLPADRRPAASLFQG